jgi:hypothetical protein
MVVGSVVLEGGPVIMYMWWHRCDVALMGGYRERGQLRSGCKNQRSGLTKFPEFVQKHVQVGASDQRSATKISGMWRIKIVLSWKIKSVS